jgi:glucosamine--fructose-6-phosphate aminotransferase (isomerizing)
VVAKNTLFVVISQSGETADTLAALRMARQNGYLSTLAICNSPESSLVRESELVMLTRAGPEIGVASTKAFTTQLTASGHADRLRWRATTARTRSASAA